MNRAKSDIDPITEFVNQGASRYSLQRSMNKIIEFESERIYQRPWTCDLPEAEGDQYIYVTKSMRLDQLAYKYYNDPKLWWVIAQVNNIKNPFTEFTLNTLIRIPSLSRLIQSGVVR